MARKQNGDGQAILPGFEPNPAITNFGIVSVALGTGSVKGDFVAATQANDLSMLTPERWAEAFAGILVKLCDGDLRKINNLADLAYEHFWAERRAREADAKIGYAKLPDAGEDALREARATLLVRMTGHNFTVPIAAMAEWGNEQIEQAGEWLNAIDEWKAGGADDQPPEMPEFILEHSEWLNAADPAANDPQADVEAHGCDLADGAGQSEGGGGNAPENTPEGGIPKAEKRGSNGKGNGAGVNT